MFDSPANYSSGSTGLSDPFAQGAEVRHKLVQVFRRHLIHMTSGTLIVSTARCR